MRYMDMKVGIFWMVSGDLIVDAVPLPQAQPYGSALQHGGHWEYWERFAPTTHEQYLLKTNEYDVFPRGRVVFFPAKRRWVVYADRCLWTLKARTMIQQAFGMPFMVRFTQDEHYCCAACGIG